MSARDVVGTLATRVALIAAGLLSSVITARYLGPDGRGAFFYWMTLVAVIVQFGNMGLHASNAYLLTKRDTHGGALLANSVLVSLVVGTLLWLVVLAVLRLSGGAIGASAMKAAALWLLAVGS